MQAGEVVARKLAAPKLKVNRRGGALFPTSYGVDSGKKNPNSDPDPNPNPDPNPSPDPNPNPNPKP